MVMEEEVKGAGTADRPITIISEPSEWGDDKVDISIRFHVRDCDCDSLDQ